jgi:hypothetical protein
MRGALKLTRVFFLALGGIVLSAPYAQTIDLTGMVKDSVTGNGIAGATVGLSQQLLSAVTDAAGAYTLTSQNPVLRGIGRSEVLNTPALKHNNLVFSATGTQRVRIDLYNLSGRHVSSLVDAILDKGNYQICPFSRNQGSQIYVVKLHIGAQTFSFKLPGLSSLASPKGLLRIDRNAGTARGFAKSAVVSDTLVVSAPGYAIAHMPITSYTGANDFLLVAGNGHAGSIMIENGSYQGCQSPMLVTVTDSDLVGAAVLVRVKSTTDPTGIAIPLKRVIGAAGTYSDSVFFSIVKSDSAARRLKVLDQDMVIASYAEASPARQDSSTTVWSGTTGQIGPGASQYFGLRAKIQINLFDGDISDSTAEVIVKSPKDTAGIFLTLRALPGNPGSFTRALGVTLSASIQDSVLAVDGRDSMGQLITMIYHDVTPQATLYGSICTWIPAIGTLILDSTAYHGTTGKMGISLIDDDILDSFAVVTVKSKKDATGIKDTLKADPAQAGWFTGQAGFSTITSAAGVIAVSAGDTVTVIYQDETPIKSVVGQASWNVN